MEQKIKELECETHTMLLCVKNHDETVEQNRQLQTELNKANDKIKTLENEIKKLKNLPFFPYPMNSGGRQDYGEFYLISHAWFSCMQERQQVGIVEVEWKADGRRCIYLGIGSGIPNPDMFNFDVRKIALYGQKIKDSNDGF